MLSNLVWADHCTVILTFPTFLWEKNGLNRKRGHAIIGFNHGLPCYVKNMALGPQFLSTWVPGAMFLTKHGKPWSKPLIKLQLHIVYLELLRALAYSLCEYQTCQSSFYLWLGNASVNVRSHICNANDWNRPFCWLFRPQHQMSWDKHARNFCNPHPISISIG